MCLLPLFFLCPSLVAGMQTMPIRGPTWLMALATVACWISRREMKHLGCRRPWWKQYWPVETLGLEGVNSSGGFDGTVFSPKPLLFCLWQMFAWFVVGSFWYVSHVFGLFSNMKYSHVFPISRCHLSADSSIKIFISSSTNPPQKNPSKAPWTWGSSNNLCATAAGRLAVSCSGMLPPTKGCVWFYLGWPVTPILL